MFGEIHGKGMNMLGTKPHLSYSQYFLPNLMDMGSLLGIILGAILNHKRVPMSTLNGP